MMILSPDVDALVKEVSTKHGKLDKKGPIIATSIGHKNQSPTGITVYASYNNFVGRSSMGRRTEAYRLKFRYK